MKKKITNWGKAALLIGGLTLLLLFVMNTELHLHPFSIHIHNSERMMEVFVQVCAFLFFDYHGKMEGFKDGLRFTSDLIHEELEKEKTGE